MAGLILEPPYIKADVADGVFVSCYFADDVAGGAVLVGAGALSFHADDFLKSGPRTGVIDGDPRLLPPERLRQRPITSAVDVDATSVVEPTWAVSGRKLPFDHCEEE